MQLIDRWSAEDSGAMLSSRDEAEKQARRQKRYARYLEVLQLHSQGTSERAIARALSINRATVRKFIHAQGFPERAPKKSNGSILEPYFSYIHRRWAEGCHNALQLWREIKEKGYGGKAAMVLEVLKASACQVGGTHARAAHAVSGHKNRFEGSHLQACSVVVTEAG